MVQGLRCLKCHVSPIFDGDKCILCGGCADVCPENCLRLVDVLAVRGDEKLQAALLARYGQMPEAGRAGGHHQGRNPLHPLRPVRGALSDRAPSRWKGWSGCRREANRVKRTGTGEIVN